MAASFTCLRTRQAFCRRDTVKMQEAIISTGPPLQEYSANASPCPHATAIPVPNQQPDCPSMQLIAISDLAHGSMPCVTRTVSFMV